MMNIRNKVSPLQKSVWDIESNPINVSPTTSELKARSSWTIPSEEKFSQKSTTQLIERPHLPQQEIGIAEHGCSTWPKTLAFILILGIICAAAVLLPLILTHTIGVITKVTTTTVTTTTSVTTSITTTSETTATTGTTSTTSTTKVICGVSCADTSTSISSRLAFYSFDLNTNDDSGVFTASGIPSPAYTTGYVGSAISFNASLNQRLSAPAMSLNSRSFTIEFWFYLINATSNNYAFFGQLSVPNTTQQCLFLVSISGQLDIGFYNNDIVSPTVLQNNIWYHAAFVYDNDKRQQFIYIDGILNTPSPVGAGPYLGTSGSITIGGADIYGSLGVPYLTGVMDHLTVSVRAKTACEILNDATLAAYFPFDGSFTDAGPNFLTATTSGALLASGFVNQAVYLSGSNSYMQISGLTGIGRPNYPFSIAFWMYPVIPGVLVYVHAAPAGLGWCTPFIGISPTGNIVVQVYSNSGSSIMQGPVIQLNTWIHIVQTYSPTNGHCLYVNGTLYTSSSTGTTYTASGAQNFLTIGSLLNGTTCANPGIVQNPFQGMIDELRIYSRELHQLVFVYLHGHRLTIEIFLFLPILFVSLLFSYSHLPYEVQLLL